MKKKINVSGLDCANCAAKFEDAINQLSGVKSASVSFLTQKITLELEDGANYDAIFEAMTRVGKKIEPDMELAEVG